MKYILPILFAISMYSCKNQQKDEYLIEQAYIQKTDSLEKELTNYKALYEVAKEVIESDSLIVTKN